MPFLLSDDKDQYQTFSLRGKWLQEALQEVERQKKEPGWTKTMPSLAWIAWYLNISSFWIKVKDKAQVGGGEGIAIYTR